MLSVAGGVLLAIAVIAGGLFLIRHFGAIAAALCVVILAGIVISVVAG